MIAQRRKRTAAEVSQRVDLARSMKLAFPHLPNTEIADRLGVSAATVKYYLSGRVKSYSANGEWSRLLFEAASLLAYNERMAAAIKFQALADLLWK